MPMPSPENEVKWNPSNFQRSSYDFVSDAENHDGDGLVQFV